MTFRKEGYNWKFCSLGGAIRIAIESGEDIAHLHELDKKLWTVLSCPVNGLYFNQKTLDILDSDNDGKIRIPEVIEASKWITSVVKDLDTLIDGSDTMPIAGFNTANEAGAILAERSEKILESLGLKKDEISIADVEAYIAGIDERCNKAKEKAAAEEELSAPFGEKSEAATAAVNALREKIADYFVRCSLIEFNGDCAGTLDVSVDSISAIAGNNLSSCTEQIASFPLSRPSSDGLLHFERGINPAWKVSFSTLKELVLDVELPGAASMDRAQWDKIVAKTDAYTARKAAIAETSAEVLDSSLAAERAFVAPVEKFILLYKYFYTFLNNFVSFKNFYFKDIRAIFQAGVLYIDCRACGLTIKVSDMSRHGNMDTLSGMFLIYCDCFSKVRNETMQIVAAMTEGPVNQIRVGKNAIFYDRDGQDWDAVVTKIVDNPISVRQAMWSPYRKFGNWCSEQINKLASDKESKTISAIQDDVANKQAEIATTSPDEKPAGKAQPFDIAKFCGIFAAIGMALGYIGSFAVSVATGFMKLTWWQMPLSIIALMFIISGPSMLIAWFKLRHRNLGPVLNANGWAINSLVLINTRFGSQLTHVADYPKLRLYDPYTKKKAPAWKKWLIATMIVLIIAFVTLVATGVIFCGSKIFAQQ